MREEEGRELEGEDQTGGSESQRKDLPNGQKCENSWGEEEQEGRELEGEG